MSQPALSVAMSVYNNEPFLAPAIESILAQTFGDYEFLILNDGSTDASAAIIDGFAAKDSRIRAIHRENRGLIASLNELVEAARAPLIARMDGDDIARPTRFAKQIAFLDANPDYGVVGSWTEDIDADGAPYAVGGSDHATSHEGFLAAIDGGPLLCHPSAIMRRDLVRAIGGYHAAFRHCEDYDLWLRLANITQLCSLPERLMQYRHTDGQVSSRHILAQQMGAAVAFLAWQERSAGRRDPTETLEHLPPIEDLDAMFGREGVARFVRARLAPTLVYSPVALRGEGYDLLLTHIRDGGAKDGLWRTVARLAKIGSPARAARLALALATH